MVFPVSIDLSKPVRYLKVQVTEETPNFVRFDADLLTLYLTRRDNAWLKSSGDDVLAMKRREVPVGLQNLMQPSQEMNATSRLDEYFGMDFASADGEIHILGKLHKVAEQLSCHDLIS
uniref:Crinkler effector protein N-terminal domain-containing protein n=1 Tax=Globisporangium ultimum (strain ATCC 200006 / CBS 805.95 / DAOM BR144) TaxID=431595 RepID=K3WB61_GLOUD